MAYPRPGRSWWVCQPVTRHFVGRGDLLARLHDSLTASAGAAVLVHALHGTGGVGKTSLAIEYAYRHRDAYDLIAWVDAEQAALVQTQLAALAPHLGVTATLDAAATASAAVAALAGHRRWLLVFDNAERPDDLLGYLPADGGHVIITSRHSGWATISDSVDVDLLTRPDAIALLLRLSPGVTDADASAIVDQLGDLPLAIEQAAAYLDQTQLPAGQYLHLLRSRAEDLLDKGHVPGAAHTVATVWDISRQRLAAASPPAAQLLELCAFLGPEPIPLDLFTAHPQLLPEPLCASIAEPVSCAEAVGAFVSYSLARRDEHTITIHRLLAAAARHALPDPQRLADAAIVLGLLQADLPADIMGRPEHWPRWKLLLAHVLAAAGRLPDDHDTPDHANAWLLDRAGTYLQTHGQPAQARPLFERALGIDEAAYGPDHPISVAIRANIEDPD